MRESLTILACILAALLTAALVGPYFVDWNAQRPFIEQRISQAVGARIHIGGAIDLELLPTPSLHVENLSASSIDSGGPSLRVKQADFELAVAPLLRGQVQFIRADIDAPLLRLPLRADGAVALPRPPSGFPTKLEFERLRIRDATIIFDRGGTAPGWSLKGLDLDAHAGSLAGPFSGSGRIAGLKGSPRFRFSTGTLQGDAAHRDRLQVALDLDAASNRPSAHAVGELSFQPAAEATAIAYHGSIALLGTTRLEGAPAVPWRIEGSLSADGGGAKLTSGQVRLGDEQHGISLRAQAAMTFASAPAIQLALKAQQIDLDAFLAGQGAGAREKWTQAFGAVLSESSLDPPTAWPLSISLDSPAVVVGGDTLTGVAARVGLRRGTPAQVALNAVGPGDSHFAVKGSLESGPAAVFRGRIDIGANDKERLANWLSPEFPDFSARLNSLPFHALGVVGDLDLSAASFAIRDLVLTADRTVLRGSAAYTRALGAQRARLFAALRSDALDLDTLPDLAGPARSAAGMDLELSLKARAVRLARFGQGMIDAGHIAVHVTRAGSDLQLKQLSISGVGGADFSATGAADDQGAALDASLDANRLGDLAALVGRVAPGPFASALATRAVALSPADLRLHVRMVRHADGDYRPSLMSLTGTARGVQVSGKMIPDVKDPSDLGLDLSLQGGDSSILLRQLGLETLPIADAGKGRISVALHGRLDQDVSAHAEASLAGTALSFQGKIVGGLAHPSARGQLTAKSDDAVPLLRDLTVVLPDATLGLPTSISSQVQADASGLALSAISGAIGGARVSGSLRLAATNSGPQIAGAVAIDQASLASMASLIFGPAQPVRSPALWSNAKLAPGLADPPRTKIALAVDRFGLAPGWTAQGAKFELELEPGVLSLDDMKMKLHGGALSGALVLRRNGATGAIAGQISASGIDVEEPFLTGQLTGAAQFTATGDSALGLAASVAGSGSATISDLVVPRTDPDALARVVAMTDKQGLGIDQPTIESALSNELDKGPLKLPSRTFSILAADGLLRLTTAPGANDSVRGTRADISLALDSGALRTHESVALSEAAAPQGWPGTHPPHVLVHWQGSAAAESRTVDAGDLIGDLSARAIARETARINAFEADIRERAFFNRRLKGLRFMEKRDREEAAFEAQQAREHATEQARRAKAAAQAQQARSAAAGSEHAQPDDPGPGPSLYAPAPPPPLPPSVFGPSPLSAAPY